MDSSSRIRQGLLLLAGGAFLLAAFGVTIGTVTLVPIGLTFFAASFLL